VDGDLPMSIFPSPVLPVEAQIGGSKTEVISATAAPGIVSGVIQVNIRVPNGIAAGDAVPIMLFIGRASSQRGVMLAMR